MRLIDADAFDKRIRLAVGSCEEELTEDFKDGISTILEMMKTAPTVDAVPVRHGHWVKWYEEVCDSFGVAYVPHCKCSECGREYDPYDANHMNYCFNCGARLDGKDGDNHG